MPPQKMCTVGRHPQRTCTHTHKHTPILCPLARDWDPAGEIVMGVDPMQPQTAAPMEPTLMLGVFNDICICLEVEADTAHSPNVCGILRR